MIPTYVPLNGAPISAAFYMYIEKAGERFNFKFKCVPGAPCDVQLKVSLCLLIFHVSLLP